MLSFSINHSPLGRGIVKMLISIHIIMGVLVVPNNFVMLMVLGDMVMVGVSGRAVGAWDNRDAVNGQARAVDVHVVVRLRVVLK